MIAQTNTLIDLEKKFWQSMVDQDADGAIQLLAEPSLMVSSHGSMQFDHAAYKKMAEKGDRIVNSFELSDVKVTFPNEDTGIVTYRVKQGVAERKGGSTRTEEMFDSSTWVRDGKDWKCVMHTEAPAKAKGH